MATEIIARGGTGGKGGEGRVERGVALYREKGREIVVYVDGTFGVPSRTTEGLIYLVDLSAETCRCEAHFYRGECSHRVAAELKASEVRRGRARSVRTATCDGCGERRPLRELVELTEDNHDGLTHFDGELLCPSCVRRCGVAA